MGMPRVKWYTYPMCIPLQIPLWWIGRDACACGPRTPMHALSGQRTSHISPTQSRGFSGIQLCAYACHETRWWESRVSTHVSLAPPTLLSCLALWARRFHTPQTPRLHAGVIIAVTVINITPYLQPSSQGWAGAWDHRGARAWSDQGLRDWWAATIK